MVSCSSCGKDFLNPSSLKRHVRTACSRTAAAHQCPHCSYGTFRKDTLKRHVQSQHPVEHEELEVRDHQGGIQGVVSANLGQIADYVRKTDRHQDRYNFEIQEETTDELMKRVKQIFQDQKNPFKLNISFGFVLQNAITDQFVFYYASTNTKLFERPIAVENESDLEQVREKIAREDLREYCKLQRPNTKFVVRLITNALFYVDKIKRYKIGSGKDLPDFIKRKHSVISFDKDQHGRMYTDNRCLFRCLAYNQRPIWKGIERRTGELLEKFLNRKRKKQPFSGVSLNELDAVEKLFEVQINVYSLDKDETATKVRVSAEKYEQVVNLNLWKNHFSYITNMGAYAKKWKCRKCGSLFDHLSNQKQHSRACSSLTRLKFHGGGYGSPKNVFDKLKEIGISVPGDLQFFPFRASFDFEANLNTNAAIQKTDKEAVISELIPASVSVCSNVPGFTHPQCFVSDGSAEKMIGLMYQYLVEISEKSYQVMCQKFEGILSQINGIVKDPENPSTVIFQDPTVVESLAKELQNWLKRMPVLGFNSGRFDVNLIRKYLFPHIILNDLGLQTIIKKISDYLSITTDHLIFLDIKNYIAAGTSYDKWLKSNDIALRKGVFPYDWFTGLDKLDETSLPEKSAFWSELRQQGITDDEYEEAKRTWVREGCQTMRDYLVWYNNRDVVPFIDAAQKMVDYWRNLGIDPFKGNAISLPGLALNFLTSRMDSHTVLPLFPGRHEDIYRMLRENIVGGLSIVNHRYHRVGVTQLPNGCRVGWIYSLDCNSLYLWALGEPTGTGIYGIWRTDGSGVDSIPWKVGPKTEAWNRILQVNMKQVFKREMGYKKCGKELEWLEWVSFQTGNKVEHRFNGRQLVVKDGPKHRYPVDGFMPDKLKIFQFHGCHWHGHGCRRDFNPDSKSLRQQSEDTISLLKSKGYSVKVKWECEWDQEKRANPLIQRFVEKNLTLGCRPSMMSAHVIVSKVKTGEFFGMVECDIEVPHWDATLIKKFEEFPPICKNVEISKDDIGHHMKKHAEKNNLLKQPRRNLINSFWGRKMLFTTPLLRWYLNNGLVVTKVYQAIEMKPRSCFGKIRDEVISHRRKADEHPDYKSAAESWKTLGNSLYGKAMTNKEKHKICKVVLDEKVGKYVNSSRFVSMEEVGDVAYEVLMDKKKIHVDLPLTVSFFVYHYAKLRMLEFVYDFLQQYLRKGSYQIVCSDTDSIVAAYESKDIDSLVIPERLKEYQDHGKKAFLATDSFTNRTPGLFKVEMSATEIVALCAKTYVARNDEDGTKKVSSKGLSKRTNDFGVKDYAEVLATKVTASGVNYGIKKCKDHLIQYRQERSGLSYLYIKRQVLSDGISTIPLHL